MKELKVCFVGIGSIAKRHIKNLRLICTLREIELQIDAVRHSVTKPSNIDTFLSKVYYSVCEAPNDYDVVFITNPTEFHLQTIIDFENKAKNFFIEKPISTVNQISKADKLNIKKHAAYYVACPLRYNAVIQYIRENINLNNVISVRSISSSYLPEWRPGTDYRNTYSAHHDLGGGVSIDLIHEWDYITSLFGMPMEVSYIHGKLSKLEIDSDDYAVYLARYIDKIVELHLDYFGRNPIRKIELITSQDTIIGDIVNNKITFLKTGQTIDFHEERDSFQIRELEHFLDILEGKVPLDNDISHAVGILKLTQGVL